jgi:hypothetical protein
MAGKNNRHTLTAQFRQSVFGRLAGYQDVNDPERAGIAPQETTKAVKRDGSHHRAIRPSGWGGIWIF